MVSQLEKKGYACCVFGSAEERAELRDRAIEQAKLSLAEKGWTANFRVEEEDFRNIHLLETEYRLVVWGERE